MVLFTAAEFKEWEGVPGTRYDASITRIAAAVTEMVNRYCSRKIEAADYVEEIDGSGTTEIAISNPPLRAVSSVIVTQLRNFSTTTPLAASQYVTESHGVIRMLPTVQLSQILSLNAPIFPVGVQNIQVSYSGGFATVPEDLKQGALMWAGALFVRRRQGGLLSSTVGPQSLTFQPGQVPVEVRSILDSYRLVPLSSGRTVVAV